jgi:hypothetical protein
LTSDRISNREKVPGLNLTIGHYRMAKPPIAKPDSTRNYLIEQVMSSPQHIGDLILPCPFGHFETWTSVPFSSFILSLTRGASHFAQVALTAIPHFAHS